MENINVTLGLNDDTINHLSSIVSDNLDIDSINGLEDKIDEKVSDAFDGYDIDTKIEDWFNDNIDIKDIVSDEISDQISDINWGSEIDVDDLDLESAAKSLLQGYNPLSHCSTAEAFTEAIGLAVRHFLLDNDNVHYVVKAIARYESDKNRKEIEEQVKAKHFEEFKQQLQSMTIENISVQNEVTYPHNHNELPSDLF